MDAVEPSREVHSHVGGSVAKQTRKCPGSANMRRRCGPSPSSPQAAEGTRLHALQEHGLRNGMWSVDDFIGGHLEDEDAAKVAAFTGAQAAAVNCVLSTVADWMAEPGAELFVEVAFAMPDIHKDAFGRCDVAVITPTRARILDAKYGKGEAVEVRNPAGEEVEGNDQGLYYAAGFRRFLEANGREMPNDIEIVIAQPRKPHDDGPVRTYKTDLCGLFEFEAVLARVLAASDVHDAPCIPGDHCRFCPGQIINAATGRYSCDAYQATQDGAAAEAFAAIDDPIALATLTPDDLAARYSRLALLRKYIRDFEAFAKLRARQVGMPGYDWVPGNRDWSWTMPAADVLAAAQAMLGDDAAAKIAAVVTPTAAEKALGGDFDAIADFVAKGRAGPQLMKAGARKKTLTLSEVQAHFAQHNDDAFSHIEIDY